MVRASRCSIPLPAVVLAGLALVAALLAFPATAQAKEYSMGPVDITATVQSNSTLVVHEERVFDFDDSFTYVFWSLDKSGFDAIKINGVSMTQDGQTTALALTTDPDSVDKRPEGYYYVNDHGSYVDVYAYFRASYEDVSFALDWRGIGLVNAWADCGELYWQAVGDQWGMGTDNVSVTIVLPVPAGESVVGGDNVLAWAHGPLSGTVGFNEDGTVFCYVPYVGSDSFVEPRVVFPVEWLSDMNPSSVEYRQAIIDQENEWAAAADRKRALRAFLGVLVGIIGVVLALALLISAVIVFFRHGREHKSTFTSQYWREMPCDEHPAVLGALWRWGSITPSDLTATIMHLCAQGIIRIDPITQAKQGLMGPKEFEDYLITRIQGVDTVHPIDRIVDSLLFNKVGGGRQQITLSQMQEYAKKHSKSFNNSYEQFGNRAKGQVKKHHWLEPKGTKYFILYMVFGILAVCFCPWFGLISLNPIPSLALAGAGAVSFALSFAMRRRSPAGNDIYMKCVGLRNWLRLYSYH